MAVSTNVEDESKNGSWDKEIPAEKIHDEKVTEENASDEKQVESENVETETAGRFRLFRKCQKLFKNLRDLPKICRDEIVAFPQECRQFFKELPSNCRNFVVNFPSNSKTFVRTFPQRCTKKALTQYVKGRLLRDILTTIVLTFAFFACKYKLYPPMQDESNRVLFTKELNEASFAGSLIHLSNLAEFERINYEILQKWTRDAKTSSSKDHGDFRSNDEGVENIKYFLPLVQAYLNDYDVTTGSIFLKPGQNRSTAVSENPLTVYSMLRRVLKILRDIRFPKNQQFNFTYEPFIQHLNNSINRTEWPTDKAEVEAAFRLYRLQEVYMFTASDLANGKLKTVNTNVSLSWEACRDLGLEGGWEFEMYSLAIEWFEEAESRLAKLTDEPLAEKYLGDTKQKRLELMKKHDETWEPTNLEILGQMYYFDKKLSDTPSTEERVPRRITWEREFHGNTNESTQVIQYWSLCSGNYYQTEKARSRLFCWLETKMHPTWTIGPLKAEFLSRQPDIVQYYDIITDELIENLRNKSTVRPMLPSRTSGDHFNYTDTLYIRSSVQSWLNDVDDASLHPIRDTVSRITGLHVGNYKSWDMLQYLSYSTGGHYSLHRDDSFDGKFMNGSVNEKGYLMSHRIATFMMYLNDVDLGGYTAFATAGTAAAPIKRSGVFWYNLNLDGTIDHSSGHGGCPVILGSKQAINKWIGSLEQFLVHKCPLEEKGTTVKIPVNGVY